jgi:GT2 family glycosyltransferase
MKGSVTGAQGAIEPSVAIVVLNWNGWRDTIECLESLSRIDYPNYDIIVVDNGSQDESIEKIREYALGKVEVKSKYLEKRQENSPLKIVEYTRRKIEEKQRRPDSPPSSRSDRSIVLLKNERDYGFAEGNNIGIRFATRFLNPTYVLLLSNDTVVDRCFLTELINVAERGSNIGIVGPKTYYYDFSGRSDIINFAGEDILLWKAKGVRYGFREADNGQHERIRPVDKIDGACMLIRKTVLEDVGLLDTVFFAYWEETDLCLRAKRKGYKLLYVPTAQIWHKVSASYVGSLTLRKEYYLTKNRFVFLGKNASATEKIAFLAYLLLIDVWLTSVSMLKLGDIRLLGSFGRGIRDGIGNLVGHRVRKTPTLSD